MATETTQARRHLVDRLGRLRVEARKVVAEAERLASTAKPKPAPRPGSVREMLDMAQAMAPPDILDPILTLARATKGEGKWEKYNEVIFSGLGLYLDLETAATSLSSYDSELLHGLLRTPDYHRALGTAFNHDAEVNEDLDMALLLDRQRTTLDRTPPCQFTAVLGESVLTRVVGSKAVMAAQIEHLLALNARDHMDIRVLPFSAGAHAGMHTGAYTLLDFDRANDPVFIFMETHMGARYIDLRRHLLEYGRAAESLRRQSVTIEEFAE